MFWSSEWYPAEQHTSRAAGREGGVAALEEGPGGWAELPQTASSAPTELPGAGEAEEQHGAGKPTRSVTATGAALCSWLQGEAAMNFFVVSFWWVFCVLNQACRESELTQKLQEEQFCLLQCAVVEAEGIILDAVAKLDDPIHVCCISSPGKTSFLSHSPKKLHSLHWIYSIF